MVTPYRPNTNMQSSVNGRWVDYSSPEAIAQRQTQQQTAQQQTQQVQQGQRQTIGDFMKTADPFAPQRQQYQTKLSDLMSNPSGAVENNPFFSASAEAGQEAARRRLAQMGMGTSGNAALELQKAAQANMSGDYFRMADLLGRFSGANVDPSAGANAGMQAWNQIENTRRFENQSTPNQFWGGQQINKKPAPLTLGNLSSYWGA